MRNFVSRKNETVRLFKNPVLEYFSHIHPATPLVVYIPLVVYMIYNAVSAQQHFFTIISLFILGVFLWTPFEYSVHRWLFHYQPKTEIGKQIHFLVHGVHHDYPRDKTRLVMPLLVSVPLAVTFFYIYSYIAGEFYYSIYAGFVVGYLCYDSIHYATHHLKMNGRIGKYLKEYHMRHHFVNPDCAYGVSNPLWDFICSTAPANIKAIKIKEN